MFRFDADVTERAFGPVTAVYAAGGPELRIAMVPEQPVRRYMAVYRGTEYWCRPAFGTDLNTVPADTVLLVLEQEDGFLVALPVVNGLCRSTLEGGCLCMTTWHHTPCRGLALVYARGSDPLVLIESCVKTAARLLGGLKLRQQRIYPEIFEYLGWCSWDSMQIRVNEAGILEKCREFKAKNIPVKWAILDDMWAHIRDFYGKTYDNFQEMVRLMHSSRMYDYEADPIRFPQGLAHCIAGVKAFGLQVGVWLPTTGYWKGLDPEGPACEKLKPHLIESQLGSHIADWHYAGAKGYFETLLGYLRQSGADFVKIDNQALFRRHYKGLAPIGQQAREFHDALEDTVTGLFDGTMINCMGMAPENLWSRKNSAVSRCSDDFLPENKAWFTKHVLQCAYNSLLQGQLYWCDWDMWWTDDGQAEKNALMRAVSGGPIYVSDQLQRSRPQVLRPLMADDGRILRCDRPGMPTADCVTKDPTVSGEAMKLQNMAGKQGILAVLNLDAEEKPVTATVCGELVEGFEAEEYGLYEHFSRQLTVLKRGEKLEITLQNSDDYRLYILVPLENGCGPIGRIDKYISPKTVRSFQPGQLTLTEPGPCAWIENRTLVVET